MSSDTGLNRLGLGSSQASLLNELPTNPLSVLVTLEKIASWLDFEAITALACTSWSLNEDIQNFSIETIVKACGPKVGIIDTNPSGTKMSGFSAFNLIHIYRKVHRKVNPHVEGNTGITLLIKHKGLTLKDLVDAGEREKIDIHIWWDAIKEEVLNVPEERDSVVVITKSVFEGTRKKNYEDQKEIISHISNKIGLEWKMGSLKDFVALCLYTYLQSGERLYSEGYPSDAWTSTNTSTRVTQADIPVEFGGFRPGFMPINSMGGAHPPTEAIGAGGILEVWRAPEEAAFIDFEDTL